MQQKEADFLAKALMKNKLKFQYRQSANARATMKDVQEKLKAKHPQNTIKQEDNFHIVTASNEYHFGPHSKCNIH